jgi:hypothetical protein
MATGAGVAATATNQGIAMEVDSLNSGEAVVKGEEAVVKGEEAVVKGEEAVVKVEGMGGEEPAAKRMKAEGDVDVGSAGEMPSGGIESDAVGEALFEGKDETISELQMSMSMKVEPVLEEEEELEEAAEEEEDLAASAAAAAAAAAAELLASAAAAAEAEIPEEEAELTEEQKRLNKEVCCSPRCVVKCCINICRHGLELCWACQVSLQGCKMCFAEWWREKVHPITVHVHLLGFI